MTIQRAIDIAAFGLGRSIDVWTLVKKSGTPIIEQVSEERMRFLEDSANIITKAQRDVFMAHKMGQHNAET
jgi:hypothetical protein